MNREKETDMENRSVNPETLRMKDLSDVKYKDIHSIRLHLALVYDDGDDEAETVFHDLGDVHYGNTISRDVIVPDDMPLWALHYMIQPCFGWQNSHLHRFSLPEEQFLKITDDKMGNHAALTGFVFRCLWMDENARFWNDDYEAGMNIKAWLRRKYKGPYRSQCYEESITQSTLDLARLRAMYNHIETEYEKGEDWEWYGFPEIISAKEYAKLKDMPEEWYEKEEFGRKHKVCRKVFAFDDIPLDVALTLGDYIPNELLERLRIKDVLAVHQGGLDAPIQEELPTCFEDIYTLDMQKDIVKCLEDEHTNIQPVVHPLTDTLEYFYDYGDGWQLKITACTSVEDLLESGRLTMEELEEAVHTLYSKYRPVCIGQDGYNLMDDVGGIGGYLRFLRSVFRDADMDDDDGYIFGEYENKRESLAWARMMGWTKTKHKNKNVL